MVKYLTKVDILRAKMKEAQEEFKIVTKINNNLTTDSLNNINNIIFVSNKCVIVLANFINSKESDSDVKDSEKEKIKSVFKYYTGMTRILSYYKNQINS